MVSSLIFQRLKMPSTTSFTNTGHGMYHHSNGIHIYFHQVQQLNNEENTVFQRNEHLELHALALTQDFGKA